MTLQGSKIKGPWSRRTIQQSWECLAENKIHSVLVSCHLRNQKARGVRRQTPPHPSTNQTKAGFCRETHTFIIKHLVYINSKYGFKWRLFWPTAQRVFLYSKKCKRKQEIPKFKNMNLKIDKTVNKLETVGNNWQILAACVFRWTPDLRWWAIKVSSLAFWLPPSCF